MKWIKYIIVCMVAVMPLTGCRKVVGPTQVRVVDPVRHYLPILQGDILRMYWTICNDGPEPLVISEIHPACSAIVMISRIPDVIIAGDSIIMEFDYDTSKNVNLSKHCIRLFGNIAPEGSVTMTFDINIVRPTVDNSDYEEHFFSPRNAEERMSGKVIRVNSYYTDLTSPDALLGL